MLSKKSRSGALAQRTQRTGTTAAWHTGHNVLPCTTVALCHTILPTVGRRRTSARTETGASACTRTTPSDAAMWACVRTGAARTRHARRTTYIVLSRDSAECISRTAYTCRTDAAPSWVHVSKNRRACTRFLLCRIRLGRRSMCACLRIILRIVHAGYREHWQLHA